MVGVEAAPMVSHFDGRCRVGGVMMMVAGLVSVVAGVVEVSINIADFHAARSSCMPEAKKLHPVANIYAHVSPTVGGVCMDHTVPHRHTQARFM